MLQAWTYPTDYEPNVRYYDKSETLVAFPVSWLEMQSLNSTTSGHSPPPPILNSINAPFLKKRGAIFKQNLL